jgi:type I restriction enzyme R subunit
MTSTHLNEASLEELIVRQMVEGGWIQGVPTDFDAGYALDIEQLAAFLRVTQPEATRTLGMHEDAERNNAARTKFLKKLHRELNEHGVIHVLRKGFGHGAVPHIHLYYPLPSGGNQTAARLYDTNRFIITRQVHYSSEESGNSLDLVTFINGLPVATFELKNSITNQNVDDAVRQYRFDRSPHNQLFRPGRCAAHFAVDDQQVKFCAEHVGLKSVFLPFDKGHNDGAGNPPNPGGIKTDYLWKQVLAPKSLSGIVESYAQVVAESDRRTNRKRRKSIFPRYHQLDVVRKILADVATNGIGGRYLIQHSAGSGKSNSIAWTASQLIELERAGQPIVDTVLVVTDRIVLDGQIRDTIKGFTQVASTVTHADHSSDLKAAIENGKRIIITTVQKFPYIISSLGTEHRSRSFAVIVDEAHSSQTGKAAAALAGSLSLVGAADEGETAEDTITRLAEQKKLPANASYFAFTATPKNKTLELFGSQDPVTGAFRPFHSYTMKQAIQEGFILDVLQGYLPVDSYYKIVKTVEGDPEFDSKKAARKLRTYVESHETAIARKAEIIVDHFLEQVIAKHKVNGKARAMVVTDSIERAIDYYRAIHAYLEQLGSPYRAIVAFSDFEKDGTKVTEAAYNGFPGKDIPERIQEEPYRILVCADKFQTGYDEPLLHTMYVDKHLSGVKAVQTLSRLNRALPGKSDTSVVDFVNDADAIKAAFEPYYRTTLLTGETDPDKLHDLKAELDGAGVYTADDVEQFIADFIGEAERTKLDPILDRCAAVYADDFEEDEQVAFKSKARAFVRTYSFLSLVLPFTNVEWEKLSIFLGALLPKLPMPGEQDLSTGILDAIDMDSYRIEKREELRIVLEDSCGELEPIPTSNLTGRPEPDMEPLSVIISQFNDLFGNIAWEDADRIIERITHEIPKQVAADQDYQNAQANNDEANARIALEDALGKVMGTMFNDEAQLFKQFFDNPSFKRWLTEAVFQETYKKSA